MTVASGRSPVRAKVDGQAAFGYGISFLKDPLPRMCFTYLLAEDLD
jgi:hypothetical protein